MKIEVNFDKDAVIVDTGFGVPSKKEWAKVEEAIYTTVEKYFPWRIRTKREEK